MWGSRQIEAVGKNSTSLAAKRRCGRSVRKTVKNIAKVSCSSGKIKLYMHGLTAAAMNEYDGLDGAANEVGGVWWRRWGGVDGFIMVEGGLRGRQLS